MSQMSPWTMAAVVLAAAGCAREVICPAGEAPCGQRCTVLAVDPSNCGACGQGCAAGEACSGGACTTCAAACTSARGCREGVCLPDLVVACFNTGDVRGVTGSLDPSGPPLPTDAGPIALAPMGGGLWSANSLSNTLSEIRFDPPVATSTSGASSLKLFSNVGAGFDDLEFVTADGGLLYVANAAVNTLVVVDPAAGVIDEVPVGAGFDFPQGVAIAAGKAYVALNGADALSVVDVSREPGCRPPDPGAPPCDATCVAPRACVDGRCQRALCGQVLGRIDLSGFTAVGGGSAKPSRLLAVGNRLYVTLNNLDPATFAPAGNGFLAVVDLGPGALDAAVPWLDLGPGCQNTADLALLGQTLWVTCGYYDFFGTKQVSGAAFVPVDLSGSLPAVGPAVPVAGSAAGSSPGTLAFCAGLGYAGDRASGKLVRLDPATGGLASATVCPAGTGGAAYVAAVACTP